jgi:sugar-phosphatase
MKNYQAALFDMDGVVADTNQSVRDFWYMLARREKITLSEEDFKHHIYGCPSEHTLTRLFPHMSAERRLAVHEDIMVYERNMYYQAMPGVVDLLRDFKRQGIPTALVTSGRRWRVNLAFQHIGISELFNAIVTVENITHGKPDPECYLLGARLLGKAAEDCLVFEDAVSGIRAGYAAGATCVGIQEDTERAQALRGVGADLVVPDFRSMHLAPSSASDFSTLVIQADGTKYARFTLQADRVRQ